MPVDKIVNTDTLDSGLTAIGKSIRAVSGTSGQLTFPQGFISAISNMSDASTPFEVISYETKESLLASTPSNNTIGVVTSEISEWIFSATEPANPVNHMVWFKTGLESKVSFNAASGNSIMVRPISAEQYIDGMWNGVATWSYIGNQWIIWWNGELYINGDQFTGYTGGWVNKGIFIYAGSIDYPSSNNAITFADDFMVIKAPSGKCTFATTVNTVDLTNFTELHCDVPTTPSASGIYVHRIETGTVTEDYDVMKSLAKGTNVLSIASLDGEYYISIGTVNSRTLQVNNIRLV